jgi:hypothetical protein
MHTNMETPSATTQAGHVTAAHPAAAFLTDATSSPRNEEMDHPRGPQAPLFNGEASKFPGWCQQMEAVLFNADLLEAVEQRLTSGQQAAASVIGAEDERYKT